MIDASVMISKADLWIAHDFDGTKKKKRCDDEREKEIYSRI
jgi:hypothetical protein